MLDTIEFDLYSDKKRQTREESRLGRHSCYATVATIAVGAIAANQQKQAAIKAADVQRTAAAGGISEERRQFDITQEAFAPTIEAGDVARERQLELLGLRGPEAGARAIEQFQESPGQQFIRQRQERSLLRNQAAIGGLGGGNVRTALQEQAAGFAQQDFQNQLSRLGGIAGQGNVGITNVAQLGAGATGNISRLLQQQGEAQAGGVLGGAAAQSKFINQIPGLIAASGK